MRTSWLAGGRRSKVRRRTCHPLRLAIIYAALGDNDRALLALDRAADILPQRVGLMLMYPEMASLAVTRASRLFAGSSACRRELPKIHQRRRIFFK